MRLGMVALLIAVSAGLAGCTAVSGGGGGHRRYGYGYGYDAAPGSIYGYGGPSYVGVPTVGGGGYVGDPGWYRGRDGDWRQRAWRNGGADSQQAERLLQEQRNAAVLRQQMLQNQADHPGEPDAIHSAGRRESRNADAIQQGQEASAIHQSSGARAAWQRKALGQQ